MNEYRNVVSVPPHNLIVHLGLKYSRYGTLASSPTLIHCPFLVSSSGQWSFFYSTYLP